MTDEYRAPTAAELRDTLHALLPHRSFELAAVRGLVGDAALMVRCSCGRALQWLAGSGNALRMDILLTWLADHDDEIFLTPEQLDALELKEKAAAAQTLVDAGFDPHDVLEVVGLPDMNVVEKATQAPALPPQWVPAARTEQHNTGYRVWPTGRYWGWQCLSCGYTTKDLIPTREQAENDAELHLPCTRADDDD